ncbi:hypothetical protein ACP4OV_018304 [Aristida adscensionis]
MEWSDSRAESDDLLSSLPADVLVSILEKLDLRDCIRAGALSRLWRRLPSQLPRLVLDIEDFLGDSEFFYTDDGDKDDDEVAGEQVRRPPDDMLAQGSDALLGAATALLASRAAAVEPIRTLAVRFLLRRNGNYMSLGRLLDGAMAGGGGGGAAVRAAELTVSTMCPSQEHGTERGIRVLAGHGRRFRALLDGCPAMFGGLTRLELRDLRLDQRCLGDVLAACGRLEVMSLNGCDGGAPRRQWHVRHERLVEFTMTFCAFHGVHLDWVPKLERFAYRSWDSWTDLPLSFGHVPRLTAVAMASSLCIRQKTFRLSQVLANTAITDLGLNFWGEAIWVKPEAPKRFNNMFRNLKYLKIRHVHEECGLLWTIFLLQAAPGLKQLYIKLRDHECRRLEDDDEYLAPKTKDVPWEVDSGFKHYGLSRITILGLYVPEEKLVTYIHRLVEVAVNLEQIQMRGNKQCKECGVLGTGFPQTDEGKDAFRERLFGSGSVTTFNIYIYNNPGQNSKMPP